MRRDELRTPCFVVREEGLRRNLEILRGICEETGCRILLAQKAFSMYRVYPLIGQYLDGTTASGLYEARLGYEEMGKENHIFSPAYKEEEMPEILKLCGHIVFNSPAQVKKYKEQVKQAGRSMGLRVNPECSTQEGHAIYDPCAPFSRLGTTLEKFEEEMSEEDIAALDGLHFHTLCEQDSARGGVCPQGSGDGYQIGRQRHFGGSCGQCVAPLCGSYQDSAVQSKGKGCLGAGGIVPSGHIDEARLP